MAKHGAIISNYAGVLENELRKGIDIAICAFIPLQQLDSMKNTPFFFFFDAASTIKHGVLTMSNKGQLLQDPFLNVLRREHVPVSIYLVNGIKLQGQVESFDQYVVLLKNTVTQMVYKHAISTVVPSRPISIQQESGSGD